MENNKKLSLDDIFGKPSTTQQSQSKMDLETIFGKKVDPASVAPEGTTIDSMRHISIAPISLPKVELEQQDVIGEDVLQAGRSAFEKEIAADQGPIFPPKQDYAPLNPASIKIGRAMPEVGSVDKPKNLQQTVRSEISKEWGGDLRKFVEDTHKVPAENIQMANDMEAHFWNVMTDKLPKDGFISQEDMEPYSFVRKYDNGDEVTEYSLGHYTYPQEVVNEYIARHNDEVLHEMRFKDDAAYRNDWFLRNVGVTEQVYRDEIADDLENRLQELRKKIVATLPAQHMRGGYAAIGAAANKPSSGAPVSIEKIDKALKVVNTLRKNNFGAGLKEGFDPADILTLGVSGIGENVALLNALNKSASGKTLTTSEQALVEAWDIQNEAEEVIDTLGGRKRGAKVGYGVSQALGFMTQTAGTGGIASLATKGIGRAAARTALLRATNMGVNKSIKEGLRYGGLKVAESAVGAAARTPFMGFTYQNYTDKRLNQFQVKERVDEATGEISKYIDKQEASALRDAANAVLESYFESQSEDVGGLIDFGITSFARALPLKGLLRNRAAEALRGPVKNGAMKLIKEGVKLHSIIGETLSEAYGDAMVNLLTANNEGWKQMATSEYWWELGQVSSILSGGFWVANQGVNALAYKDERKAINKNLEQRKKALSRIEDDNLKKELTEATLTDDLIERSKRLSGLDWSNFSREDMANAVDFIDAQTRLDVMREGATESRRLARIMPAIDEVKKLADGGALDDEQAAASLATIYSDLFRTQENQRTLNILTDRIKVAADAGISVDKINDILRGAGLTVFNPGDEIETLTGDRAIVDKVLPGAYEIVNDKGVRAVVSFEEVLQNAPEIRQIQQESQQPVTQSESAPEINPQVEQAVESARQEAEAIKNLDDDVIYEATLSDGTPVNIIKGANIVYNNQTGEVDYDASDATVVVRSNDGSKRQISIRDIDSIDQAMSVDEALQVATEAAVEVVNSQEQSETPTAEVSSAQAEIPIVQEAEATTAEQTSESPANQPEQQAQIPTLKNGDPDYNAMDAQMFTEQYVSRFGEDMTERVARNNIKASNKTISNIEKQIEDVTDPNKMPALYSKLQDAQATKDKYVAVLEELGLSSDESEDNAARVQRKKQENTSWFNKLFPDGFPNVESVILWDIANGNRIRWANKEVNGAVVSKGLGSELGLADSNAERTRRIALIGKDAPTPEEYAEQLPERLKAMGVRFEEGELRDKVLDVYASVDTIRKAKEELETMSANMNAEQEGLDYEEEQMRRNYEREQEALRQEVQADVVDEQTEQEQPTNEETQEEELSIEDEVPFMVSSDSVQATTEAHKLATEAAITALEDAGVEVVNATPEMVEEALQRKDVQMQAVNQRFNEQLDSFTEENATSVVFNLGMPSPILLAGGVADKPIKLYGNKLLKKLRKHGFNLDELKGLPTAIANPIAIFDNYRKSGNRSVLTELKTKDGNILVSIEIGKGVDIDFDMVKSIFGKDDNGVLNWINKGYLTFVDKEKALGYLYPSAPIAATANSQELDSATKIVENFENPKIVPDNSFSIGPAPVFVSNAKIALLGIKQEKATPEQWLKMIEKAGGLKAGEDKWIGLSDWLKASDKKTLTKQEVLGYINENQIQIEETTYSSNSAVETTPEFKALQEEFKQLVKSYEDKAQRNLDEYEAKLEKKYNFTDTFDTTVLNSDESKAHSSLSRAVGEAYNAAWVDLVDKYGDDFEIAFWRGYDGIRVDNAEAAGVLLGLPIDRPIYHLREDYTTNGLEGNREIALTVPTIESWNENDEVHFGDAGEGRAIAWVRFGETTDSDGKRVLVIDEVQSKRHQEGREKGYISGDIKAGRAAAKKRLREAYDAAQEYRETLKEKYNWDGIEANSFSEHVQKFTALLTPEEIAERERLDEEKRKADEEWDKYDRVTGAVPEAPFEKNWAELAMKRMLRYAAENGFDKVAWTKGDQQAERYNIGSAVDKIVSYTEDGAKTVRIYIKNNEPLNLKVDSEGKILYSNGLAVLAGQNLSDVVGKDVAVKILNAKEDTAIEGDNLRIGGEGMRAFYDQMLPSFMRKYGKKWGATVQDVTLPNVEEAGRTMHSVDVTDSMRESVMQGQPMFYRRPNGIVYGWTNGTTVYLTESGMNPNTPIHEYTHIWADAMRKHNPEGWASIVKLLKGTPVWNEVMADTNYANIHGDENKVASEALSRISGRENSAKMEAMAQQMIDENANDTVKKNRARKLLDRMRKALQEFWSWVGKELFGIKNFERIEQVTDRILYDLVSGTDLNPVSSFDTSAAERAEIIRVSKANETYLKAPNGKDTNLTPEQWVTVRTKAFKRWFGDWENGGASSQILDANGEPLVVWHGGEFATDEFVANGSMHFGTKVAALQRILDNAWGYGNWSVKRNADDGNWSITHKSIRRWWWRYDDPDDPDYNKQSKRSFATPIDALVDAARIAAPNAVVRPYFLNIRNLERTDDKVSAWTSAVSFSMDAGYDGIIYRNEFEDEGEDSYVAFYPNQIKLAEGNTTFDPDNDDVRFSIDVERRERTEKIAAEAQRVADAFGLSNEIVVAETQEVFVNELQSEDVADELINPDAIAVFTPSGRIMVNAIMISEMAELPDSIMHEFAHNVTHNGDMPYRIQDTVLEVGEERFEAFGRELFGTNQDPWVVADEIIATFVGNAANPTLYEGVDLISGVVSGQYTTDEAVAVLMESLTSDIRDGYVDVIEGMMPYVKEVLDAIKTNHDEQGTRAGAPKEKRRVRISVQGYAGEQKKGDNRSNDESYIRHEGYRVNQATSATQAAEEGRLERVNEFSIGNGEEIDRRTHSEGEFVLSATALEDAGANLQPDARVDGRGLPLRRGLLQSREGVPADAGGQLGGRPGADRADLANSQEQSASDQENMLTPQEDKAKDKTLKQLDRLNKVINSLRQTVKQAERDNVDLANIVQAALEEEVKDGGINRFLDVPELISLIRSGMDKKSIESTMDRLSERLTDAIIKNREEQLAKLLQVQVQGTNAFGIPIGYAVDDETRAMVEFFRENLSRDMKKIVETMENADEKFLQPYNKSELNVWFTAYKEIEESRYNIKATQKDIDHETERSQSFYRLAKELKANNASESQIKTAQEHRRQALRNKKAQKKAILVAKQTLAQELEGMIFLLGGRLRDGRAIRAGRLSADKVYAKNFLTEAMADVRVNDGTKTYQGTKEQLEAKAKFHKDIRIRTSAYRSYAYMIQSISRNAIGGKGFLWDALMEGKNGWVDCNDKRLAMDNIDNQEILAHVQASGLKSVADLQRLFDQQLIDKNGNPYVFRYETDRTGRIDQDIRPTIGWATYIVLCFEQDDMAPTMEKMRITEEQVQQIRDMLPEAAKKFLKWSREMLSDRRQRIYNPASLERFGTQMANIPNYFPIRRLEKNLHKVEEVEQVASADSDQVTIMANALIKRVRNVVEIDFQQNPLELLKKHLGRMNGFAANVPLARNVNILLNSSGFRDQLNEQGDPNTYEYFKAAAKVALSSYKPKPGALDSVMIELQGWLAAGKIAWRFFTALKQLLSIPAFWTYNISPRYKVIFIRSVLWPAVKNGDEGKLVAIWKWGMDNIPQLKERWSSRYAGNEKLAQVKETLTAQFIAKHAVFRNSVGKIGEWGMIPNAAVDLFACSIGCYAVYKFELEQLQKKGYSKEEANELAKRRASIAFNESQQSSEAAFIAPLQRDRTFLAVQVSLFNNSNFGYGRKEKLARKYLWQQTFNKDLREKRLALAKRRYLERFLNEERNRLVENNNKIADVAQRLRPEEIDRMVESKRAEFSKRAEKEANRDAEMSYAKGVEDVVMFKWLLNMAWAMAPTAVTYWLSCAIRQGDDEDPENPLSAETLALMFATATFRNAIGGGVLESALNGYGFTGLVGSEVEKTVDILVQALQPLWLTDEEKESFDPLAVWMAVKQCLVMGTGFDVNVYANILTGLVGLFNDRSRTTADVLRILNAPKSMIREIEIIPFEDETLDNYTRRMAMMENVALDRMEELKGIPSSELNASDLKVLRKKKKWEKNLITIRQAEAADVPYGREVDGRVVAPGLKQLDADYTDLLKSLDLTQSGKNRAGKVEFTEDERRRKKALRVVTRVKGIHNMEESAIEVINNPEAYKKEYRQIVEEKRKLIEDWNK